jgi:hypothetical protein
MLFKVEADGGDYITFYLVPDTFSAVPIARITVDNVDVLELSANEVREVLASAGRHETGQCGFRIDASLLPDLSEMSELAIYEKETGALVYRRRSCPVVEKKLLRLETRYLPSYVFDKELMHFFQYAAKQIENFGHETVTQMFLVQSMPSIYLSGRILIKNYQYHIDNVFESIICMDDPFVGLAERLLILSKLKHSDMMHILSDRDAMLLKPAASFASELNLSDAKALRKALRNLPQEVALALVNPLTRLLTTNTPDEMPRRGAVANAFDVLSSFAVVGIRDDASGFRDTVAHLMGVDAEALPVPTTARPILQLAEIIRSETKAEFLLENDLEIYSQVQAAHAGEIFA